MNRTFTAGLFLVLPAMGMLVLAGCNGDDSDTDSSASPGTVDRTSAQSVAEAFVRGVREKNEQLVLSLAAPELKAEMQREIASGWPSVPEDYQVQVDVDGDTAQFTSGPFQNRLQLIRTDGQWYIAD